MGDQHAVPASAKLARYADWAHKPVCSADKERHCLNLGGTRQLNSVLYTAVIVHTAAIVQE